MALDRSILIGRSMSLSVCFFHYISKLYAYKIPCFLLNRDFLGCHDYNIRPKFAFPHLYVVHVSCAACTELLSGFWIYQLTFLVLNFFSGLYIRTG